MNTNFYPRANNYNKALARLQRSLQSGRFATYTQQKKRQLWDRICRYARQLGIKIKAPIAAACFAAGLSLAAPAGAQTFTQQTGAANPFNGVDVGIRATPTFVDIDNDGDRDCFIGAGDGTFFYYKNTGTVTSPVYTQQTSGSNPLNGVDAFDNSAPVFVDIDNDGKKDLFTGNFNGSIFYYKNTGTPTVPAFTQQMGGLNPFNGVGVGYTAHPAVVDIDNDGDQDFFIGNSYGNVRYYKNTGNATAPVFTEQTGGSNPLSAVAVGTEAAPAFVDLDNDGDRDCFIGGSSGLISYYKNTGTILVPAFTVQTGTNNSFNGVDVGIAAAPVFTDKENDGDMDAFIGEQNGTILYYINSLFPLPLQLLNFNGSKYPGYNQLQWQTAAEVNTKSFEIERSVDGSHFAKIATVNTAGNSNNNYSINDNMVFSSKLFYRLKMIDIDSRFTYSHIIWLSNNLTAGITIYPNPVTDVININIGSAGILKTMAAIYDAKGRLMQTILINNNQQQINVKTLATGVYTIKFADGTVQRFMKE